MMVTSRRVHRVLFENLIEKSAHEYNKTEFHSESLYNVIVKEQK